MDAHVFSIPVPTGFRSLTVREGIVFEGPTGWAEFSPFPEYDHQESAAWLLAAREAASLGFPEPQRESIPVNGIVPAVSPERAAELALASNCSTIKVKVAQAGQDLDDDRARVAAVREALPDAAIRIDANGAWTVKEAVKAVGVLDELVGLEYVEQPSATVEELAEVRRGVDVLVAADESIRRAADPYRVRDLEAADIAVLKVQPLGGVRSALRIAQQIELPVVVSSAVETSIGLAAGIALAAALPDLPYACGLATGRLLAGDVVAEPLMPTDGALPVTRPALDPIAFERVRADVDVADRWLARLQRIEDLIDD